MSKGASIYHLLTDFMFRLGSSPQQQNQAIKNQNLWSCESNNFFFLEVNVFSVPMIKDDKLQFSLVGMTINCVRFFHCMPCISLLWNKQSTTNESGKQMSPMNQSQNSFWKTSIPSQVRILILYSKTIRWEMQASKILQNCSGSQQVVKVNGTFSSFSRSFCFR